MLNFACGQVHTVYTFNVIFTKVFNPRFFWGKTNVLANGSPQATFPFNSQPGSRPVTLLIQAKLPCTCAYVLCTSLKFPVDSHTQHTNYSNLLFVCYMFKACVVWASEVSMRKLIL